MKNDNIVNEAMTATLVLGFLAIFMALTVEALQPTTTVAVRQEEAK